MFRTSLKSLVLGIAVVAILAAGAVNSDACWRCKAGCYTGACLDGCNTCGPIGGYTPYSSFGYAGSYAVGYASYGHLGCSSCGIASCGVAVGCGDGCIGPRPGPIRRWLFGPCKNYCGCGVAPVCGSACGWGGGYSVGMINSGCGCGGTVIQGQPVIQGQSAPAVKPTPAAPAPIQPTPAPAPAPAPKATSLTRPDAGLVSIWVPEGAKVFVNGYETKSTGNLRQYISYGLQPGYTYNYEIRATITRNGQTMEESRTVKLTAGQRSSVAFNFTPKAGTSLASAW